MHNTLRWAGEGAGFIV